MLKFHLTKEAYKVLPLQAHTSVLNIDNYKWENNYETLVLKEEHYKMKKKCKLNKYKFRKEKYFMMPSLGEQFKNLGCTLEFLGVLFKIHLPGSHIQTLIQ